MLLVEHCNQGINMEELNKLLSSDNDWVKQRATLAVQFTEQYKNKEMDKDEYEELMQDLIRTDVVMKNATSMEAKAKLQSVISTLLKVL